MNEYSKACWNHVDIQHPSHKFASLLPIATCCTERPARCAVRLCFGSCFCPCVNRPFLSGRFEIVWLYVSLFGELIGRLAATGDANLGQWFRMRVIWKYHLLYYYYYTNDRDSCIVHTWETKCNLCEGEIPRARFWCTFNFYSLFLCILPTTKRIWSHVYTNKLYLLWNRSFGADIKALLNDVLPVYSSFNKTYWCICKD